MPTWLAPIGYLVASVLFIIGLKRLGRADTARGGNRLSAIGMMVAIVITVLDRAIVSYGVIAAGMVVAARSGCGWRARCR